jgi:thiol-disulfide isomerase/thioredoxin
MPKFGNEVPFKTELEKNAKFEGVQTEAGTACDVILVGTSGEATRWYIGQTDHLPRRVDHIVNLWVNKEGGDKTILTLTDIKPATFAQADFQIALPEGYAENKIAEPEPLLAVGTPAPDWELKTPQGQAVRLSELRGNVVVLDFWATWCGPCKMAMPKIQELHAEYESRPVKVFGVNCQEDAHGDPDAYMRSKGYTYGLLMEGDAVSKAYHVPGLPTFYVIDAKGVIVYSSIGAGEEEKIKEAVKKAVQETST